MAFARLTASAVALVLSSACAGPNARPLRVAAGEGLTDEALGSCPAAAAETMRRMAQAAPLEFLLQPVQYAQVTAVRRDGAAPSRPNPVPGREANEFARIDGSSLRGGASLSGVRVRMTRHGADSAAAELAAGNRVVVSMTDVGDDAPYATAVWILRRDGSVASAGVCEITNTRAMAAYARTLAAGGDKRTPADVLSGLLSGAASDVEDLRRHFTRPTGRTWSELAADSRTSHDAPPAEKARWRSRSVHFRLPEHWRNLPVSICTRFADAWNECLASDAGLVGRDVPLTAYYLPGQPVEVWALNRDGDLASPLGRLQSLSGAALGAATDVILVGDPTIRTVEELLDRGRTGLPPFVMTAGPPIT